MWLKCQLICFSVRIEQNGCTWYTITTLLVHIRPYRWSWWRKLSGRSYVACVIRLVFIIRSVSGEYLTTSSLWLTEIVRVVIIAVIVVIVVNVVLILYALDFTAIFHDKIKPAKRIPCKSHWKTIVKSLHTYPVSYQWECDWELLVTHLLCQLIVSRKTH